MSKQTAVEWLIDEIRLAIENENLDAMKISKLKMVAKSMERKQIIDAHGIKREHDIQNGVDFWKIKHGEQYYNETFQSMQP